MKIGQIKIYDNKYKPIGLIPVKVIDILTEESGEIKVCVSKDVIGKIHESFWVNSQSLFPSNYPPFLATIYGQKRSKLNQLLKIKTKEFSNSSAYISGSVVKKISRIIKLYEDYCKIPVSFIEQQ